MNNIIAFIPARCGSKRIRDKNIRLLNNKPLIEYSIKFAKNAFQIKDTYIITDSELYESKAIELGCKTLGIRPSNTAGDKSPDIEWIEWAFKRLGKPHGEQLILILRPTNPFRKERMISESLKILSETKASSIRGVELVKQHPHKMWNLNENNRCLTPYSDKIINGQPCHSMQYSVLPKLYIQNASFDLFYAGNLNRFGNFSGNKVAPLITKNYEGFDINYEEDFLLAELLIKKGLV